MEQKIAEINLKDFVTDAPIQEGSKENFKILEDGIYYYKHENNGCYCRKLVIPKEIFVEAFEKYIVSNLKQMSIDDNCRDGGISIDDQFHIPVELPKGARFL